jgi:hypothetical protein
MISRLVVRVVLAQMKLVAIKINWRLEMHAKRNSLNADKHQRHRRDYRKHCVGNT